MADAELNVYEAAGGEPVFRRLVEVFYARVEVDPVLRPMFPEDMEPGKHWQRLFLMQLFGGPSLYAQERGHPRLRMRHLPFPIDNDGRDRWLRCMLEAIDDVGIADPARSAMQDYFERASTFMVNTEPTASNVLQWGTPRDKSE